MKFGGITVSFAEFRNVKIVVFAEYALDDLSVRRCLLYLMW